MSTYTPIASVTLSSAQSSVTFSGIPQTYTDLVLVVNSGTTHSSSTFLALEFNGDTGTNYSTTNVYGNGSSAGSARQANNNYAWTSFFVGQDATVSTTNVITNILNYSNSTTNKTLLSRANRGNSTLDYYGTEAVVSMWRNTAAITSITVKNWRSGVSYNFASGSTFNLYGVANASITNTAKATGGDTITTDGTYWYHTFYSSGTFTPTQALTADYLVVAGGGGGGQGISGNGEGGGGGAGGLRCTVTATGGGGSLESALSLTAQAYTVTVGAGGAAGTSGSDSVFSTITSTGGGRGGTQASAPAVGGSGGGGYGRDATNNTGAAGTSNQGYAGQSGVSFTSGGGGGAAEVGGTDATRDGGDGVATSISGSSVTYAGGGGGTTGGNTGGTGGTGGGGNGDSGSGPGAGTANTGGGGGGGRSTASAAGGAGGSGIVIVRYSV